MTINAVSRSFACAPSSDGVRYTSNPAGNYFDAPAAVFSAGVLTLTGTFPSKATAAPTYFDDYESRTVGAAATTIGLSGLGGDGTTVEVSSGRSYSGTKSLRGDFAPGLACFPRLGISGLESDRVYISYNMYYERYEGSTDFAEIFKLCRAGDNASYSGYPRFYDTIRPNWTTGVIGAVDRAYQRDDGSYEYLGPDTNISKANRDAWHRLEHYYKLATPGMANGALGQWVNLIANLNVVDATTRQTGSTALIDWVMSPFVGMDHGGGTSTNGHYVYVDNLYIDRTPTRVEVGNASTLAACTERVVAVPTSWSTTDIVATLTTTTLGSGTRYVFVFDADNEQYGPSIEVVL